MSIYRPFCFCLPVLTALLALPASGEPLEEIGTATASLRLKGHRDGVIAIDWSADGKWIATGSVDKTVRIWDAGTGKSVHMIDGWTQAVTDVKFSANSKRLLAGGLDGRANVIDVSNGKLVAPFKLTFHAHAVALSADGSKAAVGSCNSDQAPIVAVYDVATKKLILSFKDQLQNVMALEFSPDAKSLAVCNAHDEAPLPGVMIVDLETGNAKTINTPDATSLMFSPDAKSLYFAGIAKTGLVRYDLASGVSTQLTPVTPLLAQGRFLDAKATKAIMPGGFGSVMVADLTAPQANGSAVEVRSAFTRCLVMSPDGSRFAVGQAEPATTRDPMPSKTPLADTDVLVFDTAGLAPGRPIGTGGAGKRGNTARDLHLNVRPGTMTGELTVGNESSLVDLVTGNEISKLPRANRLIPRFLTPDRKAELTTRNDKFVWCEPSESKTIQSLKVGPGNRDWTAAFSDDGKLIFVACQHLTGSTPKKDELTAGIHEVNAEDGTLVTSFAIGQFAGRRVMANGNQLVAITPPLPKDGPVRIGRKDPVSVHVIDLKTGKPALVLQLKSPATDRFVIRDGVAYLPDMKQITRLDLATLKILPPWPLRDGDYRDLFVSADGKQMVVQSAELVTLLDPTTGKPIKSWGTPKAAKAVVGMNPDNQPFMVMLEPGKPMRFVPLKP